MKYLKNQRGTVFLEFAVMFPIYIAILLVIVNLALLLNNSIVAHAVADEAARTAGVTADAQLAEHKAQEVLDWGGLGGAGKVNVAMPPSYSDRLNASVEYRTPIVAPGLGFFLDGKPWDSQATMKATSSRIFEYQYRKAQAPRPGATCMSCSCDGGCDDK